MDTTGPSCGVCASRNPADANFCAYCGAEVPGSDNDAPADAIQHMGWPDLAVISSSGRGTSPAERTAYLAGIDPDASWLGTIARQEERVRVALEACEQLTVAWRSARADGMHERARLIPADRDSWSQVCEDHERALAVYEHERDALFVLLDEHERATEPIPHWAISDHGIGPG